MSSVFRLQIVPEMIDRIRDFIQNQDNTSQFMSVPITIRLPPFVNAGADCYSVSLINDETDAVIVSGQNTTSDLFAYEMDPNLDVRVEWQEKDGAMVFPDVYSYRFQTSDPRWLDPAIVPIEC